MNVWNLLPRRPNHFSSCALNSTSAARRAATPSHMNVANLLPSLFCQTSTILMNICTLLLAMPFGTPLYLRSPLGLFTDSMNLINLETTATLLQSCNLMCLRSSGHQAPKAWSPPSRASCTRFTPLLYSCVVFSSSACIFSLNVSLSSKATSLTFILLKTRTRSMSLLNSRLAACHPPETRCHEG